MSAPDENKLIQAASKAARARDLMANELLTEAFKRLEDAYIVTWRETDALDVTSREKLFLAINVVGKVRDHLGSIVANGKLAERELATLAADAERKQRSRR